MNLKNDNYQRNTYDSSSDTLEATLVKYKSISYTILKVLVLITSLQYHNKWLSCNNAGNLFAFYSFSYIAIYWSYKNDFAKNIIASYCHLIGHYEPK